MNVLGAAGWQPILITIVSALVVAGFGAVLTDIGPWYFNLKVPTWKPPDWAFGPIWTTIISFSGAAAVIAWGQAITQEDRQLIILLFAVNAVLNILWSALFFRLQHPDWALLEVMLLWLSIVVLIVKLARLSALASVLLVPYLTWVSIAALLNYRIVQLNY